MNRGKYGLNLAAVAIIGFIMAFFGFTESLLFLVAYALIAEKDNWLTRQTLQALFLRFTYSIAIIVLGWIFGGLIAFFNIAKAYKAMAEVAKVQGFFNGVLYLGLFVMAALAVLKVMKGQDAGLPVLGSLVEKTMNAAESTAAHFGNAPYTAAAVYPQAPVSPPPAKTEPLIPSPQLPKDQETPPKPQPPSPPSSNTAISGTWACVCGRENTGKFCIQCGSPRA